LSLIVTDVTKSFGDKKAVNRISFAMSGPGVLGLLGSNGAGKTTTIRMILGIINKDSGSITWNGQPVTRQTVNFGYLPEERGIYPKAIVQEQVAYFGRLRGLDYSTAKKVAEKWFKRLGIIDYAHNTAKKLSKGNQTKVQFITSLVHDPDLIILDEPFSGLDPVNTDLFKSIIHELIARGKYIIMSSHQMSTVEEFCKEILIMNNGETVLSGNLGSIKAGYGRTHLSINCNEDISQLIGEAGFTIKELNAHGYEIKIDTEAKAHALLATLVARQVKILKFEIREPSLHEIFVEKVVGVS